MADIPAADHDLFDRPTIAHLATLQPDGAPHVTPVWIDRDADAGRLLVNTERGRQKVRNVERDPRVGLSMTDPDDPYRRLSVIGTVEAVTAEGAREHIDALARRYLGRDYGDPIRTDRIVLGIRPERVF